MNLPTSENEQEEGLALERWEHVSHLEEELLKQKSKLHWLNVGDTCTKTFHNAAKFRDTRNGIHELQVADGSMIKNNEEIKVQAARFFEEFLNLEPADLQQMETEELDELLNYKCSEDEQEALTREVTEKEIYELLLSMAGNKSS